MCPSLQSDHILSDEDLKHVCGLQGNGSDIYNQIQQKLLKAKLNKFPDTRLCPGQGCEFIGWVNGKCTYILECPECGLKWKDPTLYPFSYKLAYNLYGDGLRDTATDI